MGMNNMKKQKDNFIKIVIKQVYSERTFLVKDGKKAREYKTQVQRITKAITSFRKRKGDFKSTINALRLERNTFINKIRRLVNTETVKYLNDKLKVVKIDKVQKVDINHVLKPDEQLRIRATLFEEIGSDIKLDENTKTYWLTVSGEGLTVKAWFDLKGLSEDDYIVHQTFLVKSKFND